ncbi:MAG: helix-turn-helix transcriptional regulator [Betaproteobacteria bacterium]
MPSPGPAPSSAPSPAAATRSTRGADYQRVPRPVAAMALDLPSDYEIAWHNHPRFQLVYGAQGVMTVETRSASDDRDDRGDRGETWVVPPQRAVWLPPGIEHRILTSSQVKFRTLYVTPDAAKGMPRQCEAFAITPLLRELILRATELPLEYDEHGAAGRIMQLILDELASLARLPYNLPMPASRILSRICREIIASPNERTTIEALGTRHGTTTRTLARRFRSETGMSFSEWRRRARLLRALAWIAEGRPILAVALDLGYDSPSAFSAMFKREFGLPPSQYRASAGVPA